MSFEPVSDTAPAGRPDSAARAAVLMRERDSKENNTMAKKPARKPRRKTAQKVAIVTGGGTGIGRECANALARDGFKVSVIGRRPDRLKPRRGEILYPYVCDVSDHAQVKTTVKAVLADHGRIDALVNVAGVLRYEPITKMTQDTIDYVVGVNLIGTMYFSVACIPALKKTKGTIINMSSALAHRPRPRVAVYVATKGGIECFTKALAVELAPMRIRCNVVSPGLVRSEIHYTTGMGREEHRKYLTDRGPGHPLGRTGEPDDISGLVCYLASNESRWMTGVVIPIDGGTCVAGG